MIKNWNSVPMKPQNNWDLKRVKIHFWSKFGDVDGDWTEQWIAFVLQLIGLGGKNYELY